MKTHFMRLLVISIIMLFCVGCDQITKAAAKSYLTPKPISYLGDSFRLEYTENRGAFLSIGSSMPSNARFWLLCVLTGLLLAVLLVFVLLNHRLHPILIIGLSCVIGGGVGNLIDRMTNDGAVVDFMNIGIGRLRTGVFNVADVAIMIGMGMILYGSVRRSGSMKNEIM